MKYKAIIFDMDGTIIESEKIWQTATKKMIENRGVTLTPEMEKDLRDQMPGSGLKQSCTMIKMLFNFSDDVSMLMSEKGTIANDLYRSHVRFMDGFVAFHERIKKMNLKTGLATNACDLTMNITDETLNLRKLFGVHMYNVSHVIHPKPHPALYLYAADQLGVDPKECIAVEDSARGITAAKEAGMFCIGYNSLNDHQQVQDAHLIVNNYDNVDLEVLLEINT